MLVSQCFFQEALHLLFRKARGDTGLFGGQIREVARSKREQREEADDSVIQLTSIDVVGRPSNVVLSARLEHFKLNGALGYLGS